MTMPLLRITTFGALRFQYRESEIRFSTRKTAALVVYLAMNAGRRIAREFLCGLLWGDSTEARARQSLSQAISETRRKFEDDLIRSDQNFLCMDASQVWVDAIELLRLAGEKNAASIARSERLYQGDFLAFGELDQQRFDEWLLCERERLRQTAHRGFAKALVLRAGDPSCEHRLNAARAILAIDPFDEEAHRAILQAYTAQGNASLAIQYYRRLKRDLHRELGVPPAPNTTAIFQDIIDRSDHVPQPSRTLMHYAVVLEQLPHPVVVTDMQSRIVGWNALSEQAFGFSKSEIYGRTPSAVLAPYGLQGQADSVLKHALRWGRWSKRIDFVRKDGRRSRQHRIVSPLFNPEGELIGGFGHGIVI
jgi:PAS domain S-box-containing protein